MPELIELEQRLRERIRDIPDFPQPGILFKDITPVLADANLFAGVVERLAADARVQPIDVVAGIESRGFLFAAPLALALGSALVPIRKPGKLPWRTIRVDYELEYGTDALEAHEDSIAPGQRVLVVDDVLATGGTAGAAVRAIRQLGGEVVAAAFVIELAFLGGRSRLADVPVRSLLSYSGGG